MKFRVGRRERESSLEMVVVGRGMGGSFMGCDVSGP